MRRTPAWSTKRLNLRVTVSRCGRRAVREAHQLAVIRIAGAQGLSLAAARGLIGVGEGAARGQGVAVVRAQDPLPSGQGLLVQGDQDCG
jgi:hypothetical protein